MKHIITLILFCLFSEASYSQAMKTNKVKFTSINQVGLLNGDAGADYDIRTINGISIGKWSIGAGVGIDDYINRSIPLFLDVRRDLGKRNNTPFVYASGGVNYTWLNHVQKEQKGLPYSTTPGGYADAGVGLKMKTKGSVAVILSAGFSYKQSLETVTPQVWWIWPSPVMEDQTERLNSQFRRVVIRLGIQL